MTALAVYLAGPDVFFPNKFEIPEQKKAVLKKHDMEGLYPLDNELGVKFEKTKQVGLVIGRANFEMINKADVVLANMTPFRSPSMDIGTAAEMAYGYGIGKLVIGYYDRKPEPLAKRTVTFYQNNVTQKEGEILDPDGNTIEEFDMEENLMIPTAIEDSGGAIFYSFESAAEGIRGLWEKKQATKES